MAVRFAYEKRYRPVVGNDLPENGGFTGTYPANIAPSYIPPEEPPASVPALPAPAVDPALLAAVNPGVARQTARAGGYNDKTVSAVNSPLPPAAASVTPSEPRAVPDVPAETVELGEPPTPPVFIKRDKRGRPERAIGGANAGERAAAMGEAADVYVPKPEPKWQRYLRLLGLGGSMIGGAIAHDENAVARAAYGLGQNLSNSKLSDEQWQRRQQAESNAQEDRDLKRRKTAAEIANIEAQPEIRREAQRLKKVGIDTAGKRVSDARMKAALDSYHKNDYTPGENPALDKYYEDSGLHGLVARKAADKWEYKLIDGDLLRVPKSGTGEAENVTYETGGGLVTDPSKATTESVKIGDQVFDNLTPREAALLAGRAYEGEENRKSREGIAAAGQAGQDRRKLMGDGGVKPGAISTTVKGAVGALSRFRALSAKIESQKQYYGVKAGQSHPVIDALYLQRDGLERDMKQLYGSYLELDDKGKPSGLKESAYTQSAGPTVDLTGQQRSVSKWRKQYPKATAEQEAAWKAKVEAAGGTVIK